MGTDLTRIGEKARKEPGLVFTSLCHHIYDVDNLRACYDSLKANKATGVDGETKRKYGEKLTENLADLSDRLRRMGYIPQPKRRSYIPKPGSEKGRPLGISCFEDKVVESAVKRALEPIYETMFEDSSFGYRLGRSAHGCLDKLGRTIQQERVNHVVEADIKSFFDTVNHECLINLLRRRIGDGRVLRLIIRMLKSGIMEDGLFQACEEGTPQGSILSPLLSNVCLHYALDQWFSEVVKPTCRGDAWHFRYADDFLACFQYKEDAERFHQNLAERLGKFGLKLAEDKTKRIEFGRFARENARRRGGKPEEFTFLGFTHYCGKTRYGNFKVKRRASPKKYRAALRDFTEWAKKARGLLRTGEMLKTAKAKVTGHLGYYAITDNSERCGDFVHNVKRVLLKWLNRRSQRKSYAWAGFQQMLDQVGWPARTSAKT